MKKTVVLFVFIGSFSAVFEGCITIKKPIKTVGVEQIQLLCEEAKTTDQRHG
jgi:hypothetical protein